MTFKNRKFIAINIQFDSPLKVSNSIDGRSSAEIYSDTIKSALFVSGLKLFPANSLSWFWDAFFVSSLYPKINGQYTFPAPVDLQQRWNDEVTAKNRKNRKKIKWLSKGVFEALLATGKVDYTNTNNVGGALIEKVLNFGIENSNKKLYEVETRTRSMVSRQRTGFDDTTLYNASSYRQSCQHFFLIELKDPSKLPMIISCLDYLAIEGLGSDRSVGYGAFTFKEKEDIEIKEPIGANASINLGMFSPADPELILKAHYELIRRGGWLTSSSKMEQLGRPKGFVYMLKDGSVINAKSELIKGVLQNLNKYEGEFSVSHPIWREGRCIHLNMNDNNIV